MEIPKQNVNVTGANCMNVGDESFSLPIEPFPSVHTVCGGGVPCDQYPSQDYREEWDENTAKNGCVEDQKDNDGNKVSCQCAPQVACCLSYLDELKKEKKTQFNSSLSADLDSKCTLQDNLDFCATIKGSGFSLFGYYTNLLATASQFVVSHILGKPLVLRLLRRDNCIALGLARLIVLFYMAMAWGFVQLEVDVKSAFQGAKLTSSLLFQESVTSFLTSALVMEPVTTALMYKLAITFGKPRVLAREVPYGNAAVPDDSDNSQYMPL